MLTIGIPVARVRPALSSPPTLAFAGRMVQQKGVDLLLAAFRHVIDHVPSARLMIAGDGQERETLQKAANAYDLNSNLTWLGFLPREELDRVLEKAWAQVVPSRFAEALGIVAVESLMRGTAVVASSCGGLPEIVEDGGTGFLIEPGNVTALASALIRIAQNRDLAEQMGKTGREAALARFTESVYIDRLVELYTDLLRQNRRSIHP